MISKRLSRLKPSPTLALAAKSKELKAQGKDVISLSVGEPDWDTFESIKAVAMGAIKDGQTKYTPSSGIPKLRTAIAEQTNSDLGTDFTPDQVTVSIGGKYIIFSALQSLIDPGDEVIIPAPYWVSYPSMVELCDGKPVIVNCEKETNFKLSADQLKSALTEKTKMIILNTPSNPTGVMYSAAELKEIGDVLSGHPQVVVLSDDIYNRLVFAENGLAPHILQSVPVLESRTLIVNGLAKTYSMTGWRVGWALGPKEVISAMNRLQSQSVSCASPFSQLAAVEAINGCGEDVRNAVALLDERRQFVLGRLKAMENVEVESPDGAFYIWPNISYFIGKSYNGKTLKNSRDFASAFLESELVAVVPGIEFGVDGYLRLSYALSKDRMGEAMDRLERFLQNLT